jgi:hypothetical protein
MKTLVQIIIVSLVVGAITGGVVYYKMKGQSEGRNKARTPTPEETVIITPVRETPPAEEATPTKEGPDAVTPSGIMSDEETKPPAIVRRVFIKADFEKRGEDEPVGSNVVSSIEDKLAESGVGVIRDEKEAHDGTVFITYEESQGAAYGMGFTVMFHGTKILCTVKVEDAAGKEVLPELAMTGDTPSVVAIEEAYSSAVSDLTHGQRYRELGDLVAASLKEKAAAGRLVQFLINPEMRDAVAGVFERSGYELTAPREKAYLALASDDLDECVKIGAPAVEALIRYLNQSGDYDYPKDWAAKGKILTALAKINDPVAVSVVRREAEKIPAEKEPADDFEQGAATCVGALESVGSEFDLGTLSVVSAREEAAVVAAANKAAQKLWEKVGVAAETPATPPKPDYSPKVVLRVKTEPWRKDTPQNVTDSIVKQLKGAGIEIVLNDVKSADGIVLVEYSEDVDRAKASTGERALKPEGISCRASLLNLKKKRAYQLGTVSVSPGYDAKTTKSLYAPVLEAMRKSEEFTIMGPRVAATLGRTASIGELMPSIIKPELQPAIVKLIADTDYEPANPVEKAYLAIVTGNFDECIGLGKPAVEPLGKYLAEQLKSTTDYVQSMNGIASAAVALGKIGDKSASKDLRAVLKTCQPQEKPTKKKVSEDAYGDFDLGAAGEDTEYYGPEGTADSEEGVKAVTAATVAVIEALGKVGDEFALVEINRYASDGREEVAKAAQGAKAELQARLKQKH